MLKPLDGQGSGFNALAWRPDGRQLTAGDVHGLVVAVAGEGAESYERQGLRPAHRLCLIGGLLTCPSGSMAASGEADAS